MQDPHIRWAMNDLLADDAKEKVIIDEEAEIEYRGRKFRVTIELLPKD